MSFKVEGMVRLTVTSFNTRVYPTPAVLDSVA